MPISNGLTLPNTFANGQTTDAVAMMADLNYLLAALNRALLDAGGGAGASAGGVQIHSVANGTAANDAVNLGQLQTYLPLTGGALTGAISTTGAITAANNASGLELDGGSTFNTGGASFVLRGSSAAFNPYGAEWYAGGSQRLTLISDGSFGVDVSPTSGTSSKLQLAGDLSLLGGYNQLWNGFVSGGNFTYAATGYMGQYTFTQANNAFQWYGSQFTHTAGTSGITPYELMRLWATGSGTTSGMSVLCIGNTAILGTGLIQSNTGLSVAAAYTATTASTGFTAHEFKTSTSTAAGSITCSGSTTAYNTSSDERLKMRIQEAEDAGAVIDAIQVRQFDWKADGAHQRYGMIAQELAQVFPEAVHVPAEEDEMMAVDYSKLVPAMLKEVQALRARVAVLEGG